jgi:hypothetical protein
MGLGRARTLRIGRHLLAIQLLALVALAIGGARPAHAEVGPPAPPDCPLDPPAGYVCVPGPSAEFVFQGVGDDLNATPPTRCTVRMEGATPAGRVQFRTSNVCDHRLRVVTIDTRLENAKGTAVAYGPQAHCHILAGDVDCGLYRLSSAGEITNYAVATEYTQVATVRLLLIDTDHDPWAVVPVGTSPNPDEPCAPGRPEVTCELRLPIGAGRNAPGVPEHPPTPGEVCDVAVPKYCPL